MRTQEEILERFEKVNDLFGIQAGDLAAYLEFEKAKQILTDDAIKKYESGEEQWTVFTDPKKEILEYLPHAFEKAENKRGLSAMRSMLHFKTWIWLDDENFYNEILPIIDNYTNYGIPALNKIAEHYGYVKP